MVFFANTSNFLVVNERDFFHWKPQCRKRIVFLYFLFANACTKKTCFGQLFLFCGKSEYLVLQYLQIQLFVLAAFLYSCLH